MELKEIETEVTYGIAQNAVNYHGCLAGSRHQVLKDHSNTPDIGMRQKINRLSKK